MFKMFVFKPIAFKYLTKIDTIMIKGHFLSQGYSLVCLACTFLFLFSSCLSFGWWSLVYKVVVYN